MPSLALTAHHSVEQVCCSLQVTPPGLGKEPFKTQGHQWSLQSWLMEMSIVQSEAHPGALNTADSFWIHGDPSCGPAAECLLSLFSEIPCLELGRNKCLMRYTRLTSSPHTYSSVYAFQVYIKKKSPNFRQNERKARCR